MHKNKINNKIYIGQTCQNPIYRWGSNGQNYKSGYFCDAIKHYGWDNFEHIIIKENLTIEEANKLESELIIKYNTINRNFGYNGDYGGDNKKLQSKRK